jgi:hypothetical protein
VQLVVADVALLERLSSVDVAEALRNTQHQFAVADLAVSDLTSPARQSLRQGGFKIEELNPAQMRRMTEIFRLNQQYCVGLAASIALAETEHRAVLSGDRRFRLPKGCPCRLFGNDWLRNFLEPFATHRSLAPTSFNHP